MERANLLVASRIGGNETLGFGTKVRPLERRVRWWSESWVSEKLSTVFETGSGWSSGVISLK